MPGPSAVCTPAKVCRSCGGVFTRRRHENVDQYEARETCSKPCMGMAMTAASHERNVELARYTRIPAVIVRDWRPIAPSFKAFRKHLKVTAPVARLVAEREGLEFVSDEVVNWRADLQRLDEAVRAERAYRKYRRQRLSYGA